MWGTPAMPLTEEQIQRYSRNIILEQIGGEGQEKLLAAKVLIVGVGGLGSPAALYLAAAGVGTIGLLDGELVAVGDTDLEVTEQLFSKMDMDEAEVVTIYYGEEADEAAAGEISASITDQFPKLQVEVVRGGQPHYSYIISVE